MYSRFWLVPDWYPWLQEENQYLANSRESIKCYTPEMQKMIGYSVSSPFLGWVNLDDPRKLVMTEEELKQEGGKDLYWASIGWKLVPNYSLLH